jgi:hypothetical protein
VIPRILHQIWIGGEPPQQWSELSRTWRRHHPSWEHRLWTDAESRPFVERRYPGLLSLYDSYSYPVQRADVLRYMLLHHFGGAYADMDLECLRPIDPLISGQRAVLARAPPGEWTLNNAFMAAEPGHPVLDEILGALVRDRPIAVSHHEVLLTTGPAFLQRVFRPSRHPDVCVLDRRVFHPFENTRPELRTLMAGGHDAISLKLSCIMSGAYGIHYWAISWSNLCGEDLVNPDPHGVAGFQFFARLDSVGFDLRNAGRNVPELARICSACEAVVAFNTDGFIKTRLRPKRRWERRPERLENEGLYVKLSVLKRPMWHILGAGRRPGAFWRAGSRASTPVPR